MRIEHPGCLIISKSGFICVHLRQFPLSSSPRRGSHKSAWGTAQRRPRASPSQRNSALKGRNSCVRVFRPFRASHTSLTVHPGRRYTAEAVSLCPGLVCGCPCGASEDIVFEVGRAHRLQPVGFRHGRHSLWDSSAKPLESRSASSPVHFAPRALSFAVS